MRERNIRKVVAQLILALLFVCGFLIFVNYLKYHSSNRNDAKLHEIKLLIERVPVYPEFVKLEENYSSRHMDAGVYQYFRSDTDLQTVKDFYVSNLFQEGWEQEKNESGLCFYKEDIKLFIEFRAGKNVDWNYGLSYVWRESQ